MGCEGILPVVAELAVRFLNAQCSRVSYLPSARRNAGDVAALLCPWRTLHGRTLIPPTRTFAAARQAVPAGQRC